MTRPCSAYSSIPAAACRKSRMKLADVDLSHQTVTVRGKGNRVRFTVFGEKTDKALDRYLRQLERERPERTADPDGWLWIGKQGVMRPAGSRTFCTACVPTPAYPSFIGTSCATRSPTNGCRGAGTRGISWL